MAKFPVPETGILLTATSSCRRTSLALDTSNADVLGGEVLLDSEPYRRTRERWIIITRAVRNRRQANRNAHRARFPTRPAAS